MRGEVNLSTKSTTKILLRPKKYYFLLTFHKIRFLAWLKSQISTKHFLNNIFGGDEAKCTFLKRFIYIYNNFKIPICKALSKMECEVPIPFNLAPEDTLVVANAWTPERIFVDNIHIVIQLNFSQHLRRRSFVIF